MLDLPELFRQDGHKLVRNGPEYKCLCPMHEEKTPSCTIFDKGDKWRFQCFGCGWRGDTADYLEQCRGLTAKEALRAVKGESADYGTAQTTAKRPAPPREEKKEHPLLERPPPADRQHVYRNDKGVAVICINRYEATATQPKKFHPYTRERGGWRMGLPPDGRPLYRLPELLASPLAKTVMVVEGEKCVEAVEELSAATTVTTWPSGTNSWKRCDWRPVYGRPLLLVADGDQVGHEAIYELAGTLEAHVPSIMLVLPPLAAEGEDSIDIADIIAERSKKEVSAWLHEFAKPYVRKEAPAKPKPTRAAVRRRTPHYRLGRRTREGLRIEHPDEHLQIVPRRRRGSNTIPRPKLHRLAPVRWWRKEGSE